MRRVPLPLVLVPLVALVLAIIMIPPHLAQAPRHAVLAPTPEPVSHSTPCLSIQRATGDRLTTFLLNYQHDRAQALLTTNTACLKAVAEGPELTNLLGTVNALRTAGERLRVELSGLTVDAVHHDGGDIYTVTIALGETRTQLDATGARIGPTIRDQRQVIYRVRQVPGAPPGGGWLVQDESVQRRPQLSLRLEGPAAGVLASVANQSVLQSLAETATGTDLLHIVAREGFAVHQQTAVPDFFTDDGSGGDAQPSGIYARNVSASIPSYISLDSALHVYHLLQSRTLLAAETTVLPGRLRSFLHDAVLATHGQEGRVPGAPAREALARNGVYLAVAELLAGGTWPRGALSVEQMALAAREVNNISAHLATLPSPYLERSLDYTAFAPQGHYAVDAGLSGYAAALRWLQVAAPRLGAPPIQGDASTAHRSSLQAVLLILAMREHGAHGALIDQWQAIATTIGSLIAPLSSPTLRALARSLTSIYGQDRAGATSANPELLRRAVALYAAPGADGTVALFPSPTRPDDLLLASARPAPAAAPSGLDLLPALASAGDPGIVPSAAGRGRGGNAATHARSSLYAEGLRLIAALTDTSPTGLPYLQQDSLHRLRSLSALGWWTEMRQDPQPRAGLIDRPPPEPLAATPNVTRTNYVDPRATAWRSLAAITADLLALIREQRLFRHLQGPDATILMRSGGDLEGILRHLATIASDERRGAPAAAVDTPYRQNAATLLGGVALRILHHGPRLLPLAGSQSAGLAASGEGALFQPAEGPPQELWILVPIDGQPYLARGVIYSYYELPIEPPPLDDATWQAGGWSVRHLPGWTSTFEH